MDEVQCHPQSIYFDLFYAQSRCFFSSLNKVAYCDIARFEFILHLHRLIGLRALRLRRGTSSV